jgi:hypothetical protein
MLSWEKNIQFLKFESPELTKREALRDEASRENTSTAKAVTRWAEEKIKDERRRIARKNGFLFDHSSGLHCDIHPNEEVYSIKRGKNNEIFSLFGGSNYLSYFCRHCAENHYERELSSYKKDLSRGKKAFLTPECCKENIEKFDYRLKESRKGIFRLRDFEDYRAIDELGYRCSSCGAVSGNPNTEKMDDNYFVYKCVICDKTIGEYFK